MSSLAKHVISQPKPYRCLIFVVITALLTFSGQRYYNLQDAQHQLQHQQTLETSINTLEQQHQNINHQKIVLEQSNSELETELIEQKQLNAIQHATEKQLQQQLNELQNQIITLNKELMFYQTVTQGTSSSKLQIREFELKQAEQENHYLYRLVITQGRRVSKPINGKIKLSLQFTPEVDKQLSHSIAEHDLNMRYVQIIESKLKLKDNMNPKKVNVSLIQDKKERLTRSFDWHVNLNH